MKNPSMKRHFVHKDRHPTRFVVISTIVLFLIVGLYLLQFTPLRYKSNTSLVITVGEKPEFIKTLVSKDDIEAFYQRINDAKKNMSGFGKPIQSDLRISVVDLKDLSANQGKFKEGQTILILDGESLYQSIKRYQVEPEFYKDLIHYLQALPD